MEQLFEELSSLCQSSLTFPNAYAIVYGSIMSSGAAAFVETMYQKMTEHFNHNISAHLSQSQHQISIFGMIMKDYIRYAKISCPLLRRVERYAKGCVVSKDTESIFVSTCQSQFNYETVSNVFFASLDRLLVLEMGAEEDSEFQDFILCSKLIQLVYQDMTIEFTQSVCDHVRQYSSTFIERRESLSCSEIVDATISMFSFQKWLAAHLFASNHQQDSMCQAAYDVIISPENAVFSRCIDLITEKCVARDDDYLGRIYHLLEFRKPPLEVLCRVSEAVKKQIEQESCEVPALGGKLRWYFDTVKDKMCDNPTIQLHLRNNWASYLGKNKASLFRDLLRFIFSKARGDGDLSEILPVLHVISNKTEFELQYTRAAALRLVPVSEKHIKKEQAMLAQVKDCSSSYEMKGLSELFKDALMSLELHIGNVVMVSSSLWPFKPPYPSPISLTRFADEITSKYQQIFPNRTVTFPIDAWELNIRDTVSNLTIIGNGIQAEILLYMNNHPFIAPDSLEPFIPTSVVSASLKSMSGTKIPLFVKDDNGQYKVNSNFKSRIPHVKLPRPLVSEHATLNSQLSRIRENTIDSEITRIMKSMRSLQIRDLEQRVREAVSNRFTIDRAAFQARVTKLTSMNYIELDDNGNVTYVP